jgi:hypothetical protein
MLLNSRLLTSAAVNAKKTVKFVKQLSEYAKLIDGDIMLTHHHRNARQSPRTCFLY